MYNVLICDDQPDIVNALKIYLAPEGYGLFTASTGRKAQELQGGSLQLLVDGDLFKVTLSFPCS